MTHKFRKGDRVRMTDKHSRYAGELGTVFSYSITEEYLNVQFDCDKIGNRAQFPSHYFELYFRKESQEPEHFRDYESMNFVLRENIQRLNEYIAKLEDDGFKYRRAIAELEKHNADLLQAIQSYSDLRGHTDKQNAKLRSTLVLIQSKAQDVLRPTPFQEEE